MERDDRYKVYKNVIIHVFVGMSSVNQSANGLADLITCANVGFEKLRGLDFTRAQVLAFRLKHSPNIHPYIRLRNLRYHATVMLSD